MPTSKRTLGEEVADRLRQSILSGRLPAGAPLKENAVAAEMGVSRGPVREALGQLAREGMVILKRNHSAFVARLSPADLEEVHSLRMALAPLAMRLAARHVSDAEIAEMQRIVDTMPEDGTELTGQQAAEIDMRFHDAVYLSSRHRLLCQFWNDLRPLVHMVMLSQAVATPDFVQQTRAAHQAILAAFRAHDEERASALAQTHVRAAYEEVKQTYQEPE